MKKQPGRPDVDDDDEDNGRRADKKQAEQNEINGFPALFFQNSSTVEAGKKKAPRQSGNSHLPATSKYEVIEKTGTVAKVPDGAAHGEPKTLYRKNMIELSSALLLGEAIPSFEGQAGDIAHLLAVNIGYATRLEASRAYRDRDEDRGLERVSVGMSEFLDQIVDTSDEYVDALVQEALDGQVARFKNNMASGFAKAVSCGSDTRSMVEGMEMARGASPDMLDMGPAATTPSLPVGAKPETLLLHAWLTSQQVSRAVAAEAFARVEIYLRSGWAERDISDNFDGLSQEDAAAAKMLGQMAQKVAKNASMHGFGLSQDDVENIGAALSLRLDTLCMPIAVSSKNNHPVVLPAASDGMRRLGDILSNKTAGPRLVDVAMRGADGVSLHIGSVTANNNLESQGRQHATHISAIMQAINNGRDERFLGIDPTKVYFTLHASPTVGHKTTLPMRKNLQAACRRAGFAWDSSNDVERVSELGLLKLFGLLAKGQASTLALGDGLEVPVVSILRTRLCQFGAMSTPFDPNKSTGQLAEEAADLIARQAKMLGQASRYLSFRGNKSNNANSMLEVLLVELVNSITGMKQHFASPPEDPDEFETPAVAASRKKVWHTLSAAHDDILEIAVRALPQVGSGALVSALANCAGGLAGKNYEAISRNGPEGATEYLTCVGDSGALIARCKLAKADDHARQVRADKLVKEIKARGKYTTASLGNITPSARRMAHWLDDESADKFLALDNPGSLLINNCLVGNVPIDICGDLGEFNSYLKECKPASYQTKARRSRLAR